MESTGAGPEDAAAERTRAALAAHNKVALKMNVPAARIDQVVRLLPSLHAPTVSHLYDRDWLAL